MATNKSRQLIMSRDVFTQICDILNIKDRTSTKLVITLDLNDCVRVENHTYAEEAESDE